MSSTNKTTNYSLSQFLGTDHFSFLTDYNGDMLKIDTALGGLKATSDGYNSRVTQLESEQESNESRFETTATAMQNLIARQSAMGETLSGVQTTQNEHSTAISDLEKKVNEIDSTSRAIKLGLSNVTNGTPTKYTPVFKYDKKNGIISVNRISLSSANLDKFNIFGDIDLSDLSEKDKALILSEGVRFRCGDIVYSVEQTIDGNNVKTLCVVPLTCDILTDGNISQAYFGIRPMTTLPSPVVTDDGISILSYSGGSVYGYGYLMS